MSAVGRPLLAARGSPGEGGSSSHSDSPSHQHDTINGSSRAKRTLIESACQACRRRKSKCDGQRPCCSRCRSLRSECKYEAEEGESRWSALKRRNQQLEAEHEQLCELLEWIRLCPDAEAGLIFDRLRTTPRENIFSLLDVIRRERRALSRVPHAVQFPSSEQRLPPINSILPVTTIRTNVPPLTHHSSLSSEESRDSPVTDTSPVYPRARTKGLPDVLEPSILPVYLPPKVPTLSSDESSASLCFYNPLGMTAYSGIPPGLSSEDSSSSSGPSSLGATTPQILPGPFVSNGSLKRRRSFPTRPIVH